MSLFSSRKWIPVRRSNLKYYDDIDLYYQVKGAAEPPLYKRAGLKFTPQYLKDNPFTGNLYIDARDKMKCLREAQKGFSLDLTHNIVKKDVVKMKANLVDLVEESLNEPRAGGLEAMSATVEALAEGCARQPDIVRNLALISYTDYTTAIHSVNVMALTIGYCNFKNMDEVTTLEWGLAGLFHDVGKTEIDAAILSAPRRLTDHEYEQVKAHPRLGASILEDNHPSVHCAIPGALEHHERRDGSGYPNGTKRISELGQLLAIIDSFEAITNDDRMYRSAMDPIKALEVLKLEMESERLNPRLFIDFAYSLTYAGNRVNENYRKALQNWNLDA